MIVITFVQLSQHVAVQVQVLQTAWATSKMRVRRILSGLQAKIMALIGAGTLRFRHDDNDDNYTSYGMEDRKSFTGHCDDDDVALATWKAGKPRHVCKKQQSKPKCAGMALWAQVSIVIANGCGSMFSGIVRLLRLSALRCSAGWGCFAIK
jgi:hypothetical protein